MRRRGHIFRLTAVSALVVLALTGFSSGRGHRGGSHSGDGGGGCSSSRQDHDSSSSGSGSRYRHNDYDDDDSGSSSGSSSSGSSSARTPVVVQSGRVSLVECATRTAPYATVKVFNPNPSVEWFEITVRFLDASGAVIAEPVSKELIRGKATESVEVPVGGAGLAAKVVRCEVDAVARVV
ncbi:hypothetical protein ACVNF4_33690 [Streptomyces sp. S6]